MYDLCVDSIDHEENGRSLVLLDLSAAFDMLDHGVVKENRNREVQRQSEHIIS